MFNQNEFCRPIWVALTVHPKGTAVLETVVNLNLHNSTATCSSNWGVMGGRNNEEAREKDQEWATLAVSKFSQKQTS